MTSRTRLLILAAAVVAIAVVVVAVVVVRLGRDGGHLVARMQIGVDGNEIAADDPRPIADPRGTGTAVCVPLSLALAGDFTGPASVISNDIKSGVELAVDAHNAANAGCQVQVKEFDTQGDPGRLKVLAPEIVSDAYTLGMIGPTFSGVAEATGEIFSRNRLAAATASATEGSLSQHGWNTFFRAVANDEAQARAAANLATKNMGLRRVCVVDDATPFGKAAASVAASALGSASVVDCRVSVLPDTPDEAAVDAVRTAAPDAVVVVAAFQDAARVARELQDRGISARTIAIGDIADDEFIELAGGAAEQLRMVCPCAPVPPAFVEEHSAKFQRTIGPYTAEGYDLATIMLKGIDAGVLTRPQMLDWMHAYSGRGVARSYQWTTSGELTDPTVWVYERA